MTPALVSVLQLGGAFLLGALCVSVWFLSRRRTEAARIAALETELAARSAQAEERAKFIEEVQGRFAQTFDALSAEALRANNRTFLDLAQATMSTFQTEVRNDSANRQDLIQQFATRLENSLRQVDARIQELEKHRADAYGSLTAQVRGLLESQNELRRETGQLSRALRAPSVRGRWGEVQLRRVVELAGMIDNCDFQEQATIDSEHGRQRPDLVVRMPAGRTIAIDAKAVLNAYMEALERQSQHEQDALMIKHSQHVRARIEELGRKAYWEQFQPAPEFVVLFLPGEVFFSAALERDPALIEFAAERRVVLATPTTLIALLKTVHHGWQQYRIEQNAAEICRLGRELNKRISDLATHFSGLGRNLAQAVTAYNRSIGCLESRVLVTARKFEELGAGNGQDTAEESRPIEITPRLPEVPGTGVSSTS